MKMSYTIDGKEGDNWDDPEYIGEHLKKVDKLLLDMGKEIEIKMEVKIVDEVIEEE